MITKNYTADRTETPGDATSTIPAAMANYWINGVNSLISDLTPLKDAGGFYAPVGFNVFLPSGSTTLSAGTTLAIYKEIGTLGLSSNIITLPKGFFYELNLNLRINGASSPTYIVMTVSDTSNVNKLQSQQVCFSVQTGSNETGDQGYGIIDLTSAASNLDVKIRCTETAGGAVINTTYPGGLYIKKYKMIPFTAAT